MKTFLRIGVSVALLGLLLTRFGPRDVGETLLRAHPIPFAGAFLIFMLSQLLSAVRWQWLSRGVGFDVPLGRYVKWYTIGMFFGLVVPSTLGSDAARALYLGQKPPGRAFALSTVLFDRLIGLIALVAIAVVALLLGPSGPLPRGLIVAVVAGGTALVAAWLMAPFAVKLLSPKNRFRRMVENDLTPYFRDPVLLGLVLAISVVIHVLQILSQDLLVSSIGLDVSLGFVSIYHPLVSLAAAIPLTIGGFGLREAAYALLLPYEGISPDDAVALGLLWWAVGALGGLIGGAVYALSASEKVELRSRAASSAQQV